MKKIKNNFYMIILAVVIIGGIIIAIFYLAKFYRKINPQVSPTPSSQNAASSQKIDVTNNGQSLNYKKDDKFLVELNDPGDGGYQFAEPEYDKSIINLVEHIDIKPTSGAMGDFGHDQWIFEGIKSGQTNLKYEIYRSWEKGEQITVLDVNITIK